jgi:hypothetical protein
VSLTFTFGFVNTPPFYSGSPLSTLVPDVFPLAVDGRPYLIDQKAGSFARGFEQRVRDSVDQSTAPGEAAINPGGLWRRGEVSWHYGAGQKYADTAESQDYRFNTSKGVNVWTKGQLTLLNATKLPSSSGFTGTNLKMVEVNGYLYVSDGQTLKYTQDPFATTPSWTSVTGGDTPATTTINDIVTDGRQIYVAFENNGVLMTTIGGANNTDHYATSGGTYNYTKLGFAKGFVLGFHNDTASSHIHTITYSTSTSHGTPVATLRDPNFTCAGFAGGQSHIYVAGRSNDTGLVYKLGIKTDGTVDVAVVALELPIGEYPTAIFGYLGAIILGTNKGVRYCTADSSGNLIAGSLIPTTSDVKCFTAADRFVWFGWTNYDGGGGLGRLDLSTFTAPNTPAFATDLMYASSAAINSAVTMSNKRVFSISGVGVIVEDTANLVTSGYLESGRYRWGIPDRKFVARVDTRSTPLAGSIKTEMSLDGESYLTLGTWDSSNDTENSFAGSDEKTIEAQFKFTLARATATTGPTMTRWTARAYAAPFRSEFFRIPLLLHKQLRVQNKDYYFNVDEELGTLRNLVADPRIITLQLGDETVAVIVEDLEWVPVDWTGFDWDYEGTATVTMRSVEE